MKTPTDIQFVAPLNIVLPIAPGEELGAGTLTISPLRVGQALRLLGTISSLIGELSSAPPAVLMAFAAGGMGTDQDRMLIGAWAIDLLARRGDDVLQIVSVATGWSRAELEGLLPDRLIAIVLAVIEVNADFFSRSAPLIKVLGARDGLPWNTAAA
ncbi:hypothetical protein, partial [Sphaerotilus sp.]|uniref:hypothetical protein n=1 Tax=Sphaerotilus sp. TaxID=2093942 RepID=UPI00286E7372